ncbi:hypothetical protein ABVT39_022638 [Epinephelus coioides]
MQGGGGSRGRFQPISVPGSRQRLSPCQLSRRSETEQLSLEFSEQTARKSLRTCGRLLSAAAAPCLTQPVRRFPAGERLYNPRQCSETVRPRSPSARPVTLCFHGLSNTFIDMI